MIGNEEKKKVCMCYTGDIVRAASSGNIICNDEKRDNLRLTGPHSAFCKSMRECLQWLVLDNTCQVAMAINCSSFGTFN